MLFKVSSRRYALLSENPVATCGYTWLSTTLCTDTCTFHGLPSNGQGPKGAQVASKKKGPDILNMDPYRYTGAGERSQDQVDYL